MNIQGRGANEASNSLNTTILEFTACHINIEIVVDTNDFEAVRQALIPLHVKIVSVNEHVGHVERLIRTVKERTRCDYHNTPHKKFPKLMAVSSIEANIM